jgi:hypothetical protein
LAEEIEIGNFGKGGVASEETLKDLLKAIEHLAKKEGFDPKKSADKAKKLADAFDKSIDVVTDHRDALNENTKSVKRNTNVLSKSLGVLGVGIVAIGTSLSNFTKELIDGGSSLTDFAKHIPIFGSTIAGLTGYFDDTLESFREISRVGGSMGNSLEEVRRSSAQLFMTLDEFTGFVKGNSKELSTFGGTVTQGVRRVTDLQKALDETTRNQLLNMGLTFEDINESLMRYAILDRAGSRTRQINDAQLALNAASYAKSLSTLSKLTGEEIDSLEAKAAANQNDVAFQMAMSKMDKTEREKVRAGMAEVAALYGETGAEFYKQQILGIGPVTDATAMLAAGLPGIAEQIKLTAALTKDANTDMEAFEGGSIDRFVEGVKAAAASSDDLEGLLTVAAAGMDGPGKELALILQSMGKNFTDYMDNGIFDEKRLRDDLENAKKESNSRNSTTNALVTFNQAIKNARKEITDNFIDSGVFSTLSESVESIANMLGSEGFITLLKDALVTITDWTESFITTLSVDGFKSAMDMLWTDITQVIKDFFMGVTAEEQKQRALDDKATVESQLSKVLAKQFEQEMLAASSPDEETRSKAVKELARLEKQYKILEEKKASLDKELQKNDYVDKSGTLSTVGSAIPKAITDKIDGSLLDLKPFKPNEDGQLEDGVFLSAKTKEAINNLFGENGTLMDEIGTVIVAGFTGLFLLPSVVSGVAAGITAGLGTALTNAFSGSGGLPPGLEEFTGKDGKTRVRDKTSKKIAADPRKLKAPAGTKFVEGLGKGGLLGGAARGLSVWGSPVGAKAVIGAAALGTAIAAIATGIGAGVWVLGESFGTFSENMKEFENLNGEKLKSVGQGMRAVGLGIGTLGVGKVADGLGNFVQGIGGFLGNLFSIAGGNGKQKSTYELLEEFQGMEIDTATIKLKAEALQAFATGMNTLGAGLKYEGLANFWNGVSSFFFGEDTDPFKEIKEFGSTKFESEFLENNLKVLEAFATGMSTLSQVNSETVDYDSIVALKINLQKLGDVKGLKGTAEGIAELANIADVKTKLNDLASADIVGITNTAEAIKELADAFIELNKALADKNGGMLESGVSTASLLNEGKFNLGSGSGLTEETVKELNSILAKIEEHTRWSSRYNKTISKNIAGITNNNLADGNITSP